MAATDSELLDLVKDAISARLTGGVRRYGVGSRNLEYLSLSELNDMRRDLESRVARSAGGGFALAEFARAQ